jgi:WD40 repeat protein
VKLWNIEAQQEILTSEGFMGQVLFASDGSCLAACSAQGKVQIWRAPSFEEIAATETRENAEAKQP